MIIVFYKPYGVVSQFTPTGGHKALKEFGIPKNVYPCGRLDHDSEGLLVLTDQAEVQKALTDPWKGHPRTYWVQVEREPSEDALEQLRRGVTLSDGGTRPCKVKKLDEEPAVPPRDPPIRFRKTVPTAWIEMTMTEGRNRQIRRMTAAVGHPTLRLLRVSSGPFRLLGVEPGKWRQASREEWLALKEPEA